MRISIIGAGAWGSALGRILSIPENRITLWSNDPGQLEEIGRTGRNEVFFPGYDLPGDWRLEPDIHKALDDCETAVIAVPSQVFRKVTNNFGDFEGTLISVTKGIEYDTGMTMSQILSETAPNADVCTLSGPSLAFEVARGVPTAVVAASENRQTAVAAQELFHRPTFRVYTSNDIIGIELGGALKNVIAIAAGLCDGLGFGDNSKAALITRGIVEIQRLGTACGAKAVTFAGLSGLGDLTVTCFSPLSRNRTLGEKIGRGMSPEEAVGSMTAVAEGSPTSKSAHQLSIKHGVETPIISEVYALLYKNKSVNEAINTLLHRDTKAEDLDE
ncbi:MAG: NAD(P)-dependent glycerol-3-phosphate dehydrogenase [Verrucomicrobia bacterium]|nr:NAD(P)-dependent glycerol-3-phosphate dehydrogenase [Verrucomicrobiota bacterium]MCF7707755.1 NAD(P)-dependent glycerol-3-phosphate dehydrogenase [Verrucomicrobiota bacterium]